MARPARQVLALASLVVLAGCAGLPAPDATTTAPVDPALVGSTTGGGRCVDDPMHGFVVRSESAAHGGRLVHVAGNVTVPGAHYTVAEGSPTLTRTGPGAYRLEVNTTESARKPARPCETGAVVHYEATIRVPATDGFELVVRHDGRPVTGVGSASET
ncbi:MAG: hypothetical protein ABEJ76_04070 [Halanaeroarchaeum sp.]